MNVNVEHEIQSRPQNDPVRIIIDFAGEIVAERSPSEMLAQTPKFARKNTFCFEFFYSHKKTDKILGAKWRIFKCQKLDHRRRRLKMATGALECIFFA